MGKKYLGPATVLAGSAGLFAIAAPAIGQQLPGGGMLTYGFVSELRVNDNLGLDDPSPGVSTLWDNQLSLGFVSETPVSQLRFEIGGTARVAKLPGQSADTAFDEPFAEFGYVRDGANSRFEAEASYRKVDLAFADPLLLIQDDELTDTDLIADTGSRVATNARVFFEHGLTDPFGFGAELTYNGLFYTDTTDPGLYDSRTTAAAAFTRFRFTPVLEGRLTASWEKYEAEDAAQTERDTRSLAAGLSYEIDPVTTVLANLSYDYITETTNLPSSTTTQGLSGSVEIGRDMVNGSAGLVFESSISTSGRRNTLTASRALELPTGALEASLGVTRGPSGTFYPVGSLDYAYELPRGTITASLSHRVSTNTAGNDSATTSAALGYRTDLTRLSSLAFEADFAAVADLGTTPVDRTTLTSLRATYSYELTPNWDLSAGYEHRIRTETGATRRSSNEIFVVFEHKFDERP